MQIPQHHHDLRFCLQDSYNHPSHLATKGRLFPQRKAVCVNLKTIIRSKDKADPYLEGFILLSGDRNLAVESVRAETCEPLRR